MVENLTIYDFSYVLDLLDGDRELAIEISKDLLSEYIKSIGETRNYITFNDMEKLASEAHKIRGVMMNFNIKRSVDCLYKLEVMGKDGFIENEEELLNQIEEDMKNFKISLSEFQSTNAR